MKNIITINLILLKKINGLVGKQNAKNVFCRRAHLWWPRRNLNPRPHDFSLSFNYWLINQSAIC